MTRSEAEQVVKEAIEQGWAEEANSETYESGQGQIDLYDWDEINEARKALGNGLLPGEGCSVKLRFPETYDDYWIESTDDWRRLKAKVDELREILKQAAERWQIWPFGPKKAGKLGMYVEINVPGRNAGIPVRVGGMRTWRRLCLEADSIIEQVHPSEKILPSGVRARLQA